MYGVCVSNSLLGEVGLRVLLLTHAVLLGSPVHHRSLSLTGSAVGHEGLTVTVLMHRTLTHVCYTGPERKDVR